MKFGGEFHINFGKQKARILLNLTAFGEAEESTGQPLHELLEGIQTKPLKTIPTLLWHGYEVGCWEKGEEAAYTEKEFKAKLGSLDWEPISKSIVDVVSDDQDQSPKKKASQTKAKN